MPTSSANPDKLQTYSEDGLALVATLQTKASAVSQAIAALRPRSGRDHVPDLGSSDATLTDLADDWYHLDEFAGDVAKGFRAAGQDPDGDGVWSAPDDRIAQLGQVGYADRDAAILAAQAWARELDRLRNLGRDPTPAEIQAFANMAGRGQYDPAFAVTFSEQVGVEGYVKAMGLIRKAYHPDGVGQQGIAAVQVLAATLTTALDTLPGIRSNERHDPSNEHLPDNLRLDAGFVEALAGGYQLARDETSEWHVGETMDLSVLMRFTDPPTSVAVDIANGRLTPLLGTSYFDLPSETSYSLITDDPWGEYDDAVVNYATMLGRNDDAAAYYVAGTANSGEPTLQLVLDRAGHMDADGGSALAALVQKGVTHDFLGSTVLNSAIDIVGRDGGLQEIKNPHMNDALAAGVAENMWVLEQRALLDHNGNQFDARSPETLAAHDFLREVMRDESAANTIRAATATHAQEMYAGVSDDPTARMHGMVDIGRVLGLTATAYENAAIGTPEDRYAAANDAAGRINTEIGLIPGIGIPYSVYAVGAPTDWTLGAVIAGPDQGAIDEATRRAIDDAIRLNANPLGYVVVSEQDLRNIQAGGDDIEEAAKGRR